VLIASALGRSLAREAIDAKADFLLAADRQTVAKPLLRTGGKPVLTHWLEQLQQCPRLLPIEEKVYIVVNDDHLPACQEWAVLAGFPEANILTNGALRYPIRFLCCSTARCQPAA
jgi:hypothetical protein